MVNENHNNKNTKKTKSSILKITETKKKLNIPVLSIRETIMNSSTAFVKLSFNFIPKFV